MFRLQLDVVESNTIYQGDVSMYEFARTLDALLQELENFHQWNLRQSRLGAGSMAVGDLLEPLCDRLKNS
jgi:hypothetical protein